MDPLQPGMSLGQQISEMVGGQERYVGAPADVDRRVGAELARERHAQEQYVSAVQEWWFTKQQYLAAREQQLLGDFAAREQQLLGEVTQREQQLGQFSRLQSQDELAAQKWRVLARRDGTAALIRFSGCFLVGLLGAFLIVRAWS